MNVNFFLGLKWIRNTDKNPENVKVTNMIENDGNDHPDSVWFILSFEKFPITSQLWGQRQDLESMYNDFAISTASELFRQAINQNL